MKIGTKLIFVNPDTKEEIQGEIVESNFEKIKKMVLPGDICICWETGECSTYDKDFIKQFCKFC